MFANFDSSLHATGPSGPWSGSVCLAPESGPAIMAENRTQSRNQSVGLDKDAQIWTRQPRVNDHQANSYVLFDRPFSTSKSMTLISEGKTGPQSVNPRR